MNNTIHSSDDFEGMRKAGNLAASTLDLLVEKVKPGGPGWGGYSGSEHGDGWSLPKSILLMTLGSILVYSLLLGFGNLIYSKIPIGTTLIAIGLFSGWGIYRLWK